MGKTGRTNIRYSEEIKTEAVQLVIEEKMLYREVAIGVFKICKTYKYFLSKIIHRLLTNRDWSMIYNVV
ncbi:hypothetical protein AYJ08_19870 [Brevibacillus sp. SKDU10]|nr:hypothetical protein AYJ08_19870 [Brevibacillus sp. SKDU10]